MTLPLAQSWPLLVLWSSTGFVGGAWIAWRRNRWVLAPLLGATLGPIGWVPAARLRSKLHECPACSRTIPAGAAVCRHCGTAVRRLHRRSRRAAVRSVERGGRW
jgi:hypothetical protein